MTLPVVNSNASKMFPYKRLAITIICLAIVLIQVFASHGFFEADELSHFLKARDAWLDPRGILDIWGRPLCTGLYALVVPFGLTAARLMAVLVTILVGIGTLQLANHLSNFSGTSSAQLRSLWLPVLLLAQPFFLINAAAVMTEMLLAACWVWAAVLLSGFSISACQGAKSSFRHKKPILLASLLIGLGGLARPEGFFAIAAWPVFLWFWQNSRVSNRTNATKHGNAHCITARHQVFYRLQALLLPALLAGLPTLLWYLAGVWAWHNPRWSIDQWPWSFISQYGNTPLKFFTATLSTMAYWMWIPAAIGIHRALHHRQRDAFFLLVLPTFALFALHGALATFGLFGSMSLPRYFIAISPMLAILTLNGLERQNARILAAILAPLPLIILLVSSQYPAPAATDQRKLDVAIAAVQKLVPADELPSRLIAAHPYVSYRLNLPLNSPVSRSRDRNALRATPAGTVLIADSTIWDFEGSPKAADLAAWGYTTDPALSAKLDAVPTRFDVSAFKGKTVTVRVWIKQ